MEYAPVPLPGCWKSSWLIPFFNLSPTCTKLATSMVHFVEMNLFDNRTDNRIVLAAFGTIGGALFGFDISSMSAWIGTDQYLNYFNNPGSTLQGGITASMSAGSFAGAIAAGFVADILGRRGALMIASCIWVIGAAIQCSSQNVGQLIGGRVVSGLAGICSPLVFFLVPVG